jgi:beta-galactosidase
LSSISGGLVFADSAPRERQSFDADWRFTRGDPSSVGDSLSYERTKAWVLPTGDELIDFRTEPARRADPWIDGTIPSVRVPYIAENFNDSTWQPVNLPHDWGIEGSFQQELPGPTGKRPWFGVGWYRKHFNLPPTDTGRQIWLELDGAMSYALIWCNGQLAGGWPYGYTSWRIDLTPYLKPGADNVIAIRLDNPRESSRWYPGGGIYRHVWLTKTSPVAIAPLGAFVTTPRVSTESALVNVNLTFDNKTPAPAELQVQVQAFTADEAGRRAGPAVASSPAQRLSVPSGRQAQLSHTLTIVSPKLWSLQACNRYVVETTVTCQGVVIDRLETPFGIRSLVHSPDRGLWLNEERVPLRGVCLHHDLGALGAAVNTRAMERQLEILRQMGCNAIRTSHNPPAPELLDLCDRMGFLVMVEAFDCWQISKRRDDYSRVFNEWHEKDLRAMVRRDRNHPSVFQWSIGNEVLEQRETDGWKTAARLAAIVRSEDRTRPVAAGFDQIQSGYSGFQSVIDVVGYNYKPQAYGPLHESQPHLLIMGTETASTISSRGEYFFPVSEIKGEGLADFQVSSYDLYAPPWATTPDTEWAAQDQNPSVLGEFVWTGFDYLGEPTPYSSDETNLLNYSNPLLRESAARELAALGRIAVPARSSYFGIIDLAGFPKDRYYLYQARWRPDLPMAHILPHWNWPERIGQVTPVHVYTSGDEAELFLNGQSLGRKQRGPLEYRLRWDAVVYQPGELKVIAYRAGRIWAEDIQRTAGPAAKLTLAADRSNLQADGTDLCFITVKITDPNGQLVPRSRNRVKFSLTGPAEIVATDNGDATDLEPFQTDERNAYNGLALAIIRPKSGQPGTMTLRAESANLTGAEITLHSVPAATH